MAKRQTKGSAKNVEEPVVDEQPAASDEQPPASPDPSSIPPGTEPPVVLTDDLLFGDDDEWEFLDDVPEVAPDRNPATKTARDSEVEAFARIIARHYPCQVKVRTGSLQAGDHASEDGLLILYAARKDGAAKVGCVPAGVEVKTYISNLEKMAEMMLGSTRYAVEAMPGTVKEAAKGLEVTNERMESGLQHAKGQ